MPPEPVISVDIDAHIGAAYVQLGNNPISQTVEYSDEINVDLDANLMVVGIELLDTSVSIPLDDLAEKFHIKASTLARLVALIRSNAPTTASAGVVFSQTSGEYRTIGSASRDSLTA